MIILAKEKEEVKALKIRAYLKKYGSITLNVPKAHVYAEHPILRDLGVVAKDECTIEMITGIKKTNTDEKAD